jgi:hypothetical protein
MSHGGGHGHGAAEVENKKVAILISVLALLLSIAEVLGKSAQTDAIKYNVEASNTWAFFQAKTIRRTTVETAAELLEILAQSTQTAPAKEKQEQRVNSWKARAARYESEPETGEGRKELMAKARMLETRTERALAKYHNFEYSSAAFQIAIVLASSYIVTGVLYLLWGAGAMGIIGVLFSLFGMFAPHDLSFFVGH